MIENYTQLFKKQSINRDIQHYIDWTIECFQQKKEDDNKGGPQVFWKIIRSML